jgi:helix-turn-helix protein
MKTANATSLLDSLSLEMVVQLIKYCGFIQHRAALIQTVLEARVVHLTSHQTATAPPEELLTVPEAAARLKLSKPRIYELVRQGRRRRRSTCSPREHGSHWNPWAWRGSFRLCSVVPGCPASDSTT